MAEWPGILEQSAEDSPPIDLVAQKWPGTLESQAPQMLQTPQQPQSQWPGTLEDQWPGQLESKAPQTQTQTQARDAFLDPGRDIVEFGKGFLTAGPGLVGGMPKAAALGARGFSREQLKVMNDIDSGLMVREVDDPIGYQHMDPATKALTRQQVQASIATPIQDTGLYKAGGAIQDVFSGITKPAPGVTPGLMRDVGGGVGSTVAGVGMGMIPGVGVPLAGAAFTMAGSSEAMDDAIKKGATQEQIERAGRLGSAAGAMDVVDALLPMLGGAGKVAGLIKRIGTAAIKSAFIEGGQEGLQQLTQNVIAQGVYDPNRDLTEGVGYNALVGALSGGAVGGLIGGFEKHAPAAQEPEMTQEAAIRGLTGEGPPGPSTPPPSGPAQPPPPQQGELPLGPPTAQPELPLGPPQPAAGPTTEDRIKELEDLMGLTRAPTPPSGISTEPLPPTVIPEVPPVLTPPPVDPSKTMRSDIAEFIDFSTKGGTTLQTGLEQGPVDVSKMLDENQRSQQTIKSTPGANIGRIAMLLSSTLYGGPEYTAPVSLKEILQNSFDAIKGMIQKGETQGNIDIQTSGANRSITVKDDGTGMMPETLAKQFLEIAGTKKETTRASGGLGIAKMMFLLGNNSLRVTTMRNGKVSELITTGDELFDALNNPKKAPDINVRAPTAADNALFPKGRGTQISVTIPENYKDPSSGEIKPIWFDSEVGMLDDIKSLKYSPLFDNINVTFNGDTVPIGQNFPIQDFAPLTKAKFGWGTADIYVSQTDTPGEQQNAHILSNGLWQFSFKLTKKPGSEWGPEIPKTFYIDVSPTVKPEAVGYPFALNRQGFTKQAGKDFSNIFKYISNTYRLEDFNLEAESFGDMQYLDFDPKPKQITYSPPAALKPDKPQVPATRGIKKGDKVSVKDGKLVVNGKALPEMTYDEIEKFKIDASSLKIPQSKIDANRVMLHDNTSMDPTGAPLTSTSQRVSMTQAGVARFGSRFYEYNFLMGSALKQLRDVVAGFKDTAGRTYSELKTEAVGVSFDKEYHGVSIRIPFSGSYINPLLPVREEPAKAALGMVATMVHELAHHHHRSEDGLAPVMQDLLVQLDLHSTFNFMEFKQKVIRIVETYQDVMQWGNGVYRDGYVESRGVRFQVSSQQRRDGRSSGDVGAGPLFQERKGSRLSEWVNLGETSAASGAGSSDGNLNLTQHGGAADADFGISANQRQLDAETGPGVDAAARHPSTQAVYVAAKQAVGTAVSKKVQQGLQQAAAHADRINWFYEWAAGILELAKVNPLFTPLLQYVQRIQLMHREESTIQDHGVTLNKEWRRLGKQGEAVTQFLDELTNMTYRTPQEIKNGVIRQPTAQEVQQFAKRLGVDQRGLVFTQKINKFFSGFLDLIAQNAKEDAIRTITDQTALGNKLQEINAQVANLKSRPYFPFMRFGSHFVTVKNAAGDTVEFRLFERKGLVSAERRQQRFKQEMVQKHGAAMVSDGVMPPNAMPMVGMPRTLLEQIKTNLSLTAGQIDALEQLALEQSPSQSFKHRFQHKNYTPGYSKDFARSFARYVFYGAKFYARVKYAGLLRGDIAAASAVGGNKATRISNYMQDHLDHTILDAKGDHGWVKGLAFFWHLGYSPAAATTNLTQLPMFTYPYLADKFGAPGVSDVKALYAMTKAMLNVQKTFRKKGHYQNHTEFEMKAIGYGIKTGVISETQAAELAALGNQTNLLWGSAGNQAERGAVLLQQGASLMFEMSEQVNRRVTFRAALDLAQQRPKAPIVTEAMNRRPDEYHLLTTVEGFTPAQAKAIVTALHAVEETQVVYGHYARPRIFRGLGSSILVFERYTQAMIMEMVHNKGAAVRTLLLMALLGGLGGLPGAEDLLGLIKAAYRRLGFGANPEHDLRKWIIQQFNGEIEPDIVLHGLARRGFGIPAMLDALGSTWTGQPGRGFEGSKPGVNVPAPVLDFSKSVGMGQLLPVQIGKLMEPQENTDKVIAEQAQRASGAGWSIFFNMYKAITDNKLEMTDPKRWEKMVPREMGAISKAYRAYEEGRERTRSGGPAGASTVVNYDVRDTEQLMEVMAKALGYNVFREATKWDFVIAKKEAEAHVKMERDGMVEQFFEAWSGKDQREISAMRDAIVKFNDSLKGTEWRGYQISGESLKQSVEGKQRERIGMEAGVPMQKRQGPVIQHFRELYPEAKGVIDVRRAP